ncbi:hypothetical protein BC940DRAFT_311187 [Gongronella butleri]|nr:hypothetical protein BC940DRAFT_311187 [Gongronella butleri]
MTMVADSYLVLWASQTGNAEWIAKNIHTEAKKRGYKGECHLMNEYEKSDIATAGVVIFVASNTGDGDPPDNALKFWRFLRRNKEKDYFAGRQITCLGLGDTNYSNFNNTVKRIEKKCKELGATVFYEKGLADDAEGLENVVDPWIEHLWTALPKVLVSQGPVESETAVDKLADLLDKTSMASHPSHAAAAAEQNGKESVAKPEPYSFKGRKTDLPSVVEQYTHLPNTLVAQHTFPEPASPAALVLDYSGLTAGIKLTGIPKASAANIQWASLAKSINNGSKNDTIVPDFVSTPTPIVYAPVANVRCLTSKDALKRSLLIELTVDNDLAFEPGDAFGVIAPNDEKLVHALILRLTANASDAYTMLHQIKGEDLPTHLQKASSVTLADILRYGVDLTVAPRKALLRMLADHASDMEEKTRLMYLCSKQGLAQFNALRDQSPTLLDILSAFPSCTPPVSRLLDLLPAHQPRYYSVANSPISHPGRVRFVFNIVEYTSTTGVARQGVATPWLDKITGLVAAKGEQKNGSTQVALGDVRVPLFVRPSNPFVLPVDTKRPLIMIGPGTGIAPMLGFVQHRQAQRNLRQKMGGLGQHPASDIAKDFGAIHVYDGCRHRAKDYLFEDEFKQLVDDGTVTRLRVAVSREDPDNKAYVQDLMREDIQLLTDLVLNQDAAIYVCGSFAMANDVNKVFADILMQSNPVIDVAKANTQLMDWMANGKYLRDLWA